MPILIPFHTVFSLFYPADCVKTPTTDSQHGSGNQQMKIRLLPNLGLLFLLMSCSDPSTDEFDNSVVSSNKNFTETVSNGAQLLAISPSTAGRRPVRQTTFRDLAAQHSNVDSPYFVEFRSRAAADYGHMYVMYGKLNARGEVTESRIAGLHPAGDTYGCQNCSLSNWMIGHIIFVPSETGASNGDLEEKYVTSRYRINLDEANYERTVAYITKLQAENPLWNAFWRNCVSFGRDIASFIGLQTPGLILIEPKDFVDELRKMNGGSEQPPLNNAPNMTETVR